MRTVANAIILVSLAAIAAVWAYHEFWAIAARALAYNVTFLALVVLVPAVFVRSWVLRKRSA